MQEKITLIDIYTVVNRLEDKFDRRMAAAETKIDNLESFRDNLMGKVAILTVIATTIVSIMLTFIKDLFRS